MMCLPSGRTKNSSTCGYCLPALSPIRTTTLLTPSTGVFENGLHLPDAVFVVAPIGLQEGVDDFLGGRGGGEVGRVGLGKDGRADGAGAEG